jgi:hypothetical protein
VNDSFTAIGLGFRPKRKNLNGWNFLDEEIKWMKIE